MPTSNESSASSQPSFAERAIELERYMTGLPFGTLDSAIFTDLMKAIREQQAALEAAHKAMGDCSLYANRPAQMVAASMEQTRAVLARWRIE